MDVAPLLFEIGCEEIPARMIPSAADDLRRRLVQILDQAEIQHGPATTWGGSRRLAVRVEEVRSHQPDREELVLGPPAKVAFGADGSPTAAAVGFARKQGIDSSRLERVETERGVYAGFRRQTPGLRVAEILAQGLPPAVEGMSFPKTMRWGEGRSRWVRPVHWLLALHGKQLLAVELFGVRADAHSVGHRFLSRGSVAVKHPDRYQQVLRKAYVVIDPLERRRELDKKLHEAADRLGGRLLEDPALLEETANLVEWPQIVEGRLDEKYLDLPREILVTTLRHHQKCFSLQRGDGRLLPAFLAVTNTNRDPAGHIRRGNEWVVAGRLEDACFFWNEDRKAPLASRSPKLASVVFHAGLGTYADKARRMETLAARIAKHSSLSKEQVRHCRTAAGLAKNDLVTGTVGEFPELQGRVGGLLLRAEAEPEPIALAVYSHYQPTGRDDDIPSTTEGRVVALADKLDSVAELVRIGEAASGSRDPFGLRRACNGIFRIGLEAGWDLSVDDLCKLAGGHKALRGFMTERLDNFLREQGYTAHEIRSVVLVGDGTQGPLLPLSEIKRRLDEVSKVWERPDFAHLVDLTKRTHNIIPQASQLVLAKLDTGWVPKPPRYEDFRDPKAAGLKLRNLIEEQKPRIEEKVKTKQYDQVLNLLAEFVGPVERFFQEVLVIDPDQLDATYHRTEMLIRLRDMLTRYFDLRQLPGQAQRS